MSRTKFFRKVVDGDDATQRLQSNIESAIGTLLRNPLTNGVLLESINLVSGTTAVAHKLDREIRGWLIVDKSNASTIYKASSDSRFLNLVSSGAITVSIWVF